MGDSLLGHGLEEREKHCHGLEEKGMGAMVLMEARWRLGEWIVVILMGIN